MMKRLIIHMGMPKCGSSSIQHYMAELEKKNLSHGVSYPASSRTLDGYRNHEPLVRLTGETLKKAIETITKEAKSARGVDTCFISAEGWGRRDRLTNLNELISYVKQRDPKCDVRVIVYLRNPFRYVESCYAQMIVAGLFGVNVRKFFRDGKGNIDAFVEEFERLQGYPIYSNLSAIKVIRAALPGTPISFRSIERGDSDQSSLIGDLCSFLQIPTYEEVAGETKNERKNLRQLTVLRRARRKFRASKFDALRSFFLSHPLCSIETPRETRLRGMHVGRKLATAINMAVDAERSELRQYLDTRVEGLCTSVWQPINTTEVIGSREIAEIFMEARELLRSVSNHSALPQSYQ